MYARKAYMSTMANEKSRRTKRVALRLYADELALLERAARREPLSGFIRRVALEVAAARVHGEPDPRQLELDGST